MEILRFRTAVYLLFGYVIANWTELTDEQKLRYRSCYCGLCRRIKANFTSASRISLNYDMTFLLLLLNSLYEPPETAGETRCAAHWARPHADWYSDVTDYCAAVNVALACYNALDDWNDDRSLPRLALSRALRPGALSLERTCPRQAGAITSCLRELSALEASGKPDPDAACNCFGALMGEIFVWKDDRWAPTLRACGQALGRFVYMLDAVCDLERDRARGRYNPLSGLAASGRGVRDFQDDLAVLIGESTAAFEKLPLVQDAGLLRNILYSGVWTRYEQALAKESKKKEGSL